MARLSEERLAHVAFLYYVQGMSQAEVASALNVTRSNVSRMLTQAREQSIVRFEITYPLDREPVMEKRLLARFADEGIREVIVVPNLESGVGRASQALLSVGRAACAWLENNLSDGQVLGLCWGGTIESMVASAHFNRHIDVEVVQMAGELSIDSRFSGHDLVRRLAEKIGGRYRYFNAPATTPDEATAKALAQSPQVAEALAAARASDVAVLGIGQYGSGSSDMFLQRADASDAEIREASEAGAVGQVSGRFYDSDGQQIDLAINRRILSLDLTEVRNVGTVVAVVSGAHKAGATRAAIAGGLVDVLVVDEALGRALLAL